MARRFTKDLANYLSIGAGTINSLINGAAAVSVHSKVRFESFASVAGSSDDVFSVTIDETTKSGVAIQVTASDTAPKLRVGGRSNTIDSFGGATGTTTLVTNRDYYCGVVMDYSAGVVRAYLNGLQETSSGATFNDTTYVAGSPTGHDGIGANFTNSTPTSTDRQFNGKVFETAVWDIDIGPAGYLQLASGKSPRRVRRESLVFYMRLLGRNSPEIDEISFKLGTITGSVPVVSVIESAPQALDRVHWALQAAAAGGGWGPLIGGRRNKLLGLAA